MGYINISLAQSDSLSVVFEPELADSNGSVLPFFIAEKRSFRYPNVNYESKNRRFATYGETIFFELLSDSSTVLEFYEGVFNIGYDIVSISSEDFFDENFVLQVSSKITDTVPSEIVVSVPVFIKSGRYCKLSSNGQVSVVGDYENNSKSGKWFFFNENGHLDYVEQYKNDNRTSRKNINAKAEKNRIRKKCAQNRKNNSSWSALPPITMD